MCTGGRDTSAMDARSRGEVIQAIVARTDLGTFNERILDSFWHRPEFQEMHPPRDELRAWVRWNLDLVIRWLVEGRAPTEAELEIFRARARERAAEGTPADLVPSNFRRGARFAWAALLEAATDEERPALLDSADLLFEYVDRVSQIFSDVYQDSARSAPVAAQEAAARGALRRICADEPPLAEDHLLAEQIAFELERASRPFVIVAPERSSEYHAALASRLRRRGALAASEGRRVVGLCNRRLPWHALELDSGTVIADGPGAIRSERGPALEEMRTVVEIAAARGDAGVVSVDDYLPDLLLRRSPRVARRIHGRVYGPLQEHPELARTLDVLVANSFQRAPTAAALPVHRNTLRDRVKRISELTGVDLDRAEGQGLAWLACLAGSTRAHAPSVD
jgi:PucR C-terminal helix-turn-helix domain